MFNKKKNDDWFRLLQEPHIDKLRELTAKLAVSYEHGMVKDHELMIEDAILDIYRDIANQVETL